MKALSFAMIVSVVLAFSMPVQNAEAAECVYSTYNYYGNSCGHPFPSVYNYTISGSRRVTTTRWNYYNSSGTVLEGWAWMWYDNHGNSGSDHS